MDSVPFQEVLDRLSYQTNVWVRAAAARTGGEWKCALLELTTPIAPPEWPPFPSVWEYENAYFAAAIVSGTEVAHWLRAGHVSVHGTSLTVTVVPPDQQVSRERNRSKESTTGSVPLLWPHVSYRLYAAPQQNQPPGLLIAQSAPSFVDFGAAATRLLGLPNGQSVGINTLPTPSLRIQDTAGRILGVEVRPTELAVTLEGADLVGSVLELTSSSPYRAEVELASISENTVILSTPAGLDPGSWLVLKKGGRWIDMRFLNLPYTIADSDVTFATDPQTDLQGLVATGEGATIEFKSVIPITPDTRDKVYRTVAAFANGDGGDLLFGVEDDGTICGIASEDSTPNALDTITQTINSTVTPRIQFTINRISLDEDSNRWVVHVRIPQGSSPPYGIKPENPRYYIRRGATTFPASADQVRALALSRPASSPQLLQGLV